MRSQPSNRRIQKDGPSVETVEDMQVDDDDDEASGTSKAVQEERHNARAVVTGKNDERATDAAQSKDGQDKVSKKVVE